MVRYIVDMHTLPIIARSVAEWVERVAVGMEAGRCAVERPDEDTVYLTWQGLS